MAENIVPLAKLFCDSHSEIKHGRLVLKWILDNWNTYCRQLQKVMEEWLLPCQKWQLSWQHLEKEMCEGFLSKMKQRKILSSPTTRMFLFSNYLTISFSYFTQLNFLCCHHFYFVSISQFWNVVLSCLYILNFFTLSSAWCYCVLLGSADWLPVKTSSVWILSWSVHAS